MPRAPAKAFVAWAKEANAPLDSALARHLFDQGAKPTAFQAALLRPITMPFEEWLGAYLPNIIVVEKWHLPVSDYAKMTGRARMIVPQLDHLRHAWEMGFLPEEYWQERISRRPPR